VVVACNAVMVTSLSAVTSDVVTISVAEVVPAGIVNTGGTATTAWLLLVNSTSTPPAGAGPVSVTVATTSFVPTTDEEASVSEARVTGGGWSVTVVERVTPCREAETITGVVAATGLLVNGTVAVVVPAEIVVPDGAATSDGSLELIATAAPPAAAGPSITGFALSGSPPTTVGGVTLKSVSTGGSMVSPPRIACSPSVAVTETGVSDSTGVAAAAKVTERCPSTTATLAGTSNSREPLSIRIVIPRSDAAPSSMSVAVALDPPRTLRESNANEAIDGGTTVSFQIRPQLTNLTTD